MTTILVTGATGNLGHHVVRQLARRGVTTRALVRDPAAAAARIGEVGEVGASVELHAGDLDDPATIRTALQGVDRVFVNAADGPAKVAQERRVIDLAAEAGVELVVKLSALHADESSPLPAFAWHGTVERHLAASGLSAVVLQPAFFMANLLMVAPGVAATDTLFAPTGGAKVAMVDVRDVAEVAAAVLCDPGYAGRTLTVTGPEAITFDDVAAAIGAAVGCPIRYVDLTPEEARPRFAGAALPPWVRRHLEGVFELIRNGEFARTSDTVRAVTGGPGIDITAFARDHAAAFAG
jgi:uncharacterized protein YbjT (DUF2867 family)